MRELERGEIVLAPDPYQDKSGRRPFAIVSDERYPFYPHGYLGIPVTTQDRSNTCEIMPSDKSEVMSGLHVNPSYVNPWSPTQVNNYGDTLLILEDSFVDMLVEQIGVAVGLEL